MGVISDSLAQTDAPDASTDNRTGTQDEQDFAQSSADPFSQGFQTGRFDVDREIVIESLQLLVIVSTFVANSNDA